MIYVGTATRSGRLIRHLETRLWRLKDNANEAGHVVDGATLESASDAKMLDLIDRELGSG